MRRITFWLSLVLIFIVPWEDSVTLAGVGSLTRLIGLGVAGLWVVTILIAGRFRKPLFFHALVFLFFCWNFLSIFWTLNIDGTLQRIITYAQMFILMLIIWELFQKPEDFLLGLQAYVLGAYVAVGSVIINYINGQAAVVYEGRYSATGVNAVDLALILILGLPLAWYLFSMPRSGKNAALFIRLINLAYIPAAIFAILLTGSRTSLFAIIPFAIYIFGSRRLSFSLRAVIFVVLLIAILVSLPYLPQSVTSRLSTTIASVSSADLGGRVSIWRAARDVLANHPFLGSGSGTMVSIIGSASHNTFISVIAETGVIGFLLFSLILLIVFYRALRLPEGYSELWLAVLATWVIGVSSLSWEFRKPTWLFLSFVIIQSSLIGKPLLAPKKPPYFSANVTPPLTEEPHDEK